MEIIDAGFAIIWHENHTCRRLIAEELLEGRSISYKGKMRENIEGEAAGMSSFSGKL